MPDTGSALDVVSEDFAKANGLSINSTKARQFRLPNGAYSRTIGHIKAEFRFDGEDTRYERIFHVVSGLPEDVIIGREFLEKTQTMTLHGHRIREYVRPCVLSGARVFLLHDTLADTDPAQRTVLPCTINGQPAEALPDTGSDLMLISGDFARRHNFEIYTDLRTLVQLADGSTTWTDGMVLDAELGFDIGDESVLAASATEYDLIEYLSRAHDLAGVVNGSLANHGNGKSQDTSRLTLVYDLHVMEDLPYDMVLSNQFVFENRVFQRLQGQFVSTSVDPIEPRQVTRQATKEWYARDVFHIRNKDDSWWYKLLRISISPLCP